MSSSDEDDLNSDEEFIDLSALWRGPYLLHDDEDEESSDDGQNDSAPGIVLELTPLTSAETQDEAEAQAKTSTETPAETSTEASTETSTDTSAETSNGTYIVTTDESSTESSDESSAETSAETSALNLAEDDSSPAHRRYLSRARRRLLLAQEGGFYSTDPSLTDERSFYRMGRFKNKITWHPPSITEGSSIRNNRTVEPSRILVSQSGQNRRIVPRMSVVNETSYVDPSTSFAPTVSSSPSVNKPTFHATKNMSDDGESETDSSTSTGPEAAPEADPEADPEAGPEAVNQVQLQPNSALIADAIEKKAEFEQMALDIARRYSAEQQDNSPKESEDDQSSDSAESAAQ